MCSRYYFTMKGLQSKKMKKRKWLNELLLIKKIYCCSTKAGLLRGSFFKYKTFYYLDL